MVRADTRAETARAALCADSCPGGRDSQHRLGACHGDHGLGIAFVRSLLAHGVVSLLCSSACCSAGKRDAAALSRARTRTPDPPGRGAIPLREHVETFGDGALVVTRALLVRGRPGGAGGRAVADTGLLSREAMLASRNSPRGASLDKRPYECAPSPHDDKSGASTGRATPDSDDVPRVAIPPPPSRPGVRRPGAASAATSSSAFFALLGSAIG
jgi:hypothetical protein